MELGSPDVASPQTAHEYVRETLRRAILTGRLPGGTRLVQAEIAKQLRVSITPVREALRDLATEQLIRLDPHRGGVVHELSDGELQEIISLRRLIEGEAMRRAAERISPDALRQARQFHESMLATTDSADWVVLNRRFHLAIYEAADSPRLLGIARNLIDSSVLYVSATGNALPSHSGRAGAEHEALLRLLGDGDVEGAVAAIQAHVAMPLTVAHLVLDGDAPAAGHDEPR